MDKRYTAAMVVIGNEILSGRTEDQNINYLACKLVERGVDLQEVRIVPDVEDAIISALNALKVDVDYVFTTGGIGPTHDDITAACVAKACGVGIEEHKGAHDLLLDHYGEDDLTAARLRMANMPAGATLIPNPVSAAPGFKIENIYVMAGVPSIMQAMLDHILPTLKGGAVLQSKTVPCDLTESVIASALGEIQENHSEVDIGSYPYFADGKLGVNIVLRSSDEQALDSAERDVIRMVEEKKS